MIDDAFERVIGPVDPSAVSARSSFPVLRFEAPSRRAPAALGPIGLGCVTFGREIDRAASFAMLDHAWSRGITFFDTAAAYGKGSSETILGEWLKAHGIRPEAYVVTTKLLPPFPAAAIQESIRQSLARLQLESVDLLYFHKWNPTAESDEALQAMDELVRAGMVRSLGASNFNGEQLARVLARQKALGLTPIRALQNNQNVAVRDVTAELRQRCGQEDIAVVTYSPLGAGFLTGKHQQNVQAGTRFDVLPAHQNVYFHDEAHRRLARLLEVAARSGHSPAQLALAWALHQSGPTTVLVGGRTLAHLDQAFTALALHEPALMAELEAG